VAVGPDHHPAGEGVLLEDDLMNDPRAGLPKSGAVAGADRSQEVVDLAVAVEGGGQVQLAVIASFDEVIAVGGRGDPDLIEASGHELQPGHLGRCVLHGHPVGS